MPAIPQRLLLASTAAGLPLCAMRSPARAAQFDYKYGGNLPATHPLTVRIQEAAGLVPLDRPFDSGFREIKTSTRPIASPGDLRGVKPRVKGRPAGPAGAPG